MINEFSWDNLVRATARVDIRYASNEDRHKLLTSSAACWIAPAILGSRPYEALTIEAAFFSTPKALIKGGGNLSVGPPISKNCRDLEITLSRQHVSGYHLIIPLCLSAPVAIGRNTKFSEGIPFCAESLFWLKNFSMCKGIKGERVDIPLHELRWRRVWDFRQHCTGNTLSRILINHVA